MSTITKSNIVNACMLGLEQLNRTKIDFGQGIFSCAVYVDIIGFSRFEQRFGREQSEVALQTLELCLSEILHESLPTTWIVRVIHIWDDGYALLLNQPDLDNVFFDGIHQLISSLETALGQRLAARQLPKLRIRYGISRAYGAFENPSVVYEHITRAGRIARRTETLPPAQLVREFYTLLYAGNIQTLYQPIVNIRTQTLIGWESLTRGPVNTELNSPVRLFECAESLGHLFQLETLCRTNAIKHANLPEGAKLFINISPNIFTDPKFREGETRRLLDKYNLSPGQIVFEITENQAIRDFYTFKQVIDYYRNQGYQIAIDDTGAGYSGLVTLLEVKPDFIKIDMSLVRNIHLNATKQRIVSAIESIGREIGALVIGEGVENDEERQTLEKCGVQFGQGYLFGKPTPRLSF